MNDVVLTSCSTYRQEEVYNSIKKALDQLGGIEKFVKPGQRVLLKPNILTSFKPEECATTNPEIIRAIIRVVKEAKAYPTVGESPGFGSLERCAKAAGIKQITSEENIPLIDLATPKEVHFSEGVRFKSFIIAQELDQFDLLINLPKFKTHGLTGISGAVKNVFGCVPGVLKSQQHFKIQKRDDFIQMLLDLYHCIKPVLNIMDAVWAMEGKGGPSTGQPKFMGIIGASPDAEALDQALIKVIKGETVQGFSFPDFKKIELMTQNVYHLPFSALQKYLNRIFSEKPVINPKKCINCGICVKMCAAEALQSGIKTPKFDYDKCIRCFCCQEMCPEHAISIHRNRFAEFVSKILSRL